MSSTELAKARLKLRSPAAYFRLGLRGLPSQCAVCFSWPAAPVCAACLARFAAWPSHRCRTCAVGLPVNLSAQGDASDRCMDCLRLPPPLDRAFAAVAYGYPWSSLVARFKFGEQPGWAAFFADLLLAQAGAVDALDALSSDDFLLPLPLSPERLAQRGYNQAWQLALALATSAQTAGRADARMLLRVKHTRAQSQLPRNQRLHNVANAFAVETLRASALAGRRVVLVDDVMTSGASIFSAASALRQAGVKHITALVFARTEAP